MRAAPNHSIHWMRASRSAQSHFEGPRRLARTADGDRYPFGMLGMPAVLQVWGELSYSLAWA